MNLKKNDKRYEIISEIFNDTNITYVDIDNGFKLLINMSKTEIKQMREQILNTNLQNNKVTPKNQPLDFKTLFSDFKRVSKSDLYLSVSVIIFSAKLYIENLELFELDS